MRKEIIDDSMRADSVVRTDSDELKPVPDCCKQPVDFLNPRAYLLGVMASVLIVGIYLGMNTLTSDWYFAKIQFSEYRWWIISLAIGIGIQGHLVYAVARPSSRQKNNSGRLLKRIKEVKSMKRFMIPRVAHCSQGCWCQSRARR